MIVIGLLFLVLVCFFLGFFIWIKHRYSFWIRKQVPQLKPIFPFGNYQEAFTVKNTISVNDAIYKIYKQFRESEYQHGGYYSFITPVWMPTDLNLIKNIFQKDFQYFTDHAQFLFHHKKEVLSEHLFSLEGEKWRTVRSKLTPTFRSGELKIMFDDIHQMGNILEEKIGKHLTVDITEIVACFSTDVIARCVFGMETNCMDNPDVEFRQIGKKLMAPRIFNFLLEFLLPWNLLGVLGYKSMHKDATRYFTNITTKTIKMKEKMMTTTRNNFLDLLLKLKNDSFTIQDVMANMLLFYSAGFETTSNTISFCLYELSKHQDIQNKLRKEIKRVLEKYEGNLTYDGIQEMHYAQQCIEETLRLYPPGGAISRTCTQTYKVPNSNLVIDKGTQVIISVLGIHRDAEYYNNPLTFNPENFNKANKAKRHPYTWIPFGEGPRQCIGVRFAMMQTKVALSCMLKNHRFSLNQRTPEEVSFKPGQLISQAKENLELDVFRII